MKYKWSEGKYDSIARFCVAITNFHVSLNPLHASERTTWHSYKRRAMDLDHQSVTKRRMDQRTYRERRAAREW